MRERAAAYRVCTQCARYIQHCPKGTRPWSNECWTLTRLDDLNWGVMTDDRWGERMQTSEAVKTAAGAEQGALSRGLKSRHIQLIALGGTIGVGLFLGSAKAIHKAGPGLLLSYVIGGAAIFFIMRALGELLTYRPVAGSFACYAEEFVGPFAG